MNTMEEFLIIGKDGCGFCDRARILCHDKRKVARYLKLGSDISIEEATELVGEFRTVPQIVHYDTDGTATHIGGYDKLVEWFKS